MSFESFIAVARDQGASDLHLEAGLPAAFRVRGTLKTGGEPVPARALLEMARDLLMLTIGDYVRDSRPLPTPRRHRGSKYCAVPLQAAKVDLFAVFLASGLKKAELARRIGIPKTHIERLFLSGTSRV